MFFDVDRSRWPEPNYENPVLAGRWLMFVEYILLALSTIVIALRLVSRGYVLKTLGWDDFCAVMSWVCAVVLTAGNVVLIDTGYGRHIWDVIPEKRRQLLLNVWLYQWVAAVSTGFSKMSILFFLLRFIDGKWARSAVHATMVYVGAWSFTCMAVWIFRCNPVSTWWKEEIPAHGRCMSTEWFLKATGTQVAFGALSHVLILFLPVSTLWKLNISKWKKAWFVFVLWMGGTCCAFASGRLYYTVMGVRNQDMTWYGYSALLFQALEVHTQVFYTCTPFLGPTAQAISKPVVAGLKKISGSSLTTPIASQNRSSVVQSNNGGDVADIQGPSVGEKQIAARSVTTQPINMEDAPFPSPIRSLRRGGASSVPGTANSSASSLAVEDEETGARGLTPPTRISPRISI